MSVTDAIGVQVGDIVETGRRRVGETSRGGEVLEVLDGDDRPHYRVRWQDGHESILYPGEGVTFRHPSRKPVKSAPAELTDILDDAGVPFEVLPHRRTETAKEEATALGALAQTVAKTVVCRSEGDARVRAVIPASTRVDLGRLARSLGVPRVELVPEAELAVLYPEFELGAVPPFGGAAGEEVVVDVGLAECEHVLVEAGVHHVSIRLRCEDLLNVADARLADIAVR